MSRDFLDTHVLVYADDLDAGRKRKIARRLLSKAVRDRTGTVSTQVLQEYCVAATRKLGVEVVAARRKVELLTSLDVVLVEPDAAVRRRIRARMRKEDRALGGAIWRLRTARGVRRDEFGAIDEKTIARIERGEVAKPRRATLGAVASRLGVSVKELATY